MKTVQLLLSRTPFLVSLSPVFAFVSYFKYNELKLTFSFLFSCIVIHPSSRSIALNLYHLNFLNFCTCRTSLHFIVLALSDRQTVPQGGCSSVRHSKSYSFVLSVFLLCSMYSKSSSPTSKLSVASSRVATLLSFSF